MYRHSVNTIWRRTLRRLDRRTASLLAIRPELRDSSREERLHREAVRLSNQLAARA